MKLSLHPSFQLSRHGILSHDHGGSSPMASPLNSTSVLVVTYEYMICLSSGERPQPPSRQQAQGLLLGSFTLGTACRQLRPNKSAYGAVPSSGKRLGNQVCHTRTNTPSGTCTSPLFPQLNTHPRLRVTSSRSRYPWLT
jgi:hypothetical protein